MNFFNGCQSSDGVQKAGEVRHQLVLKVSERYSRYKEFDK